MEYPNENMEEFFKKSLDKFNDVPSEDVWSRLDERLEKDKPRGFMMNWFKYLLPAILLLGGLSAIFYYQLNLLEDYKAQLSKIIDQNKDLQIQLELKNNDVTDVAQTVNPLYNGKLVNEELQSEFIRLIDTVYIIKYVENESRPILMSRLDRPFFDFSTHETNQFLDSHFGTIGHDLASSSRFTKQKSSRSPVLLSNYIKDRVLLSQSPVDTMFTKMTFAYRGKSKRKRKKKKQGLFEPKGPIIIDQSDPWGQPEFYYRAGVSLNIINSLKGESFSNSSIGFGYGLLQEIGLTSRFSINSGIMRNTQEYALSNRDLPLEMSQISNFPNQENLRSNILRVEVENRFWEIPIGIKYDFYQDNKKSFFINPAVKWSIHQPQQFNYYLAEDRFNSFSTDQKFGYLNAIHFAFGIEKEINPFTSYQVSIAYDHNLEPIGIEQQRLHSLYLKANLLFGKK